MITTTEANDLVRLYIDNTKTEFVSLEKARGRTLAEDVYSKRDLPPFDRVAMDGIAISSDLAKKFNPKLSFRIEDIQAAGDSQKILKDKKNGCLEAMTGAILPENADMVIPYEQLNIEDNIAHIRLENPAIQPFKNIHKQGSDLKAGERVLEKGQKISSPVIAILASEGISKVKVFWSPQIAIISTGSELVKLNETPDRHQIYMSNSYALKSELENFGYDKINIMHIADNEQSLFHKLQDILNNHDMILLTGGVSKGKFDYVPQVLSDLKVSKIFHKVAQKPGKPLWFGTGPQKQIVLGLPGNPVSCLMNLRRYVIPNLIKEKLINVHLKEEVAFKKAMTLFQAVKIEHIEGVYWATPILGNGSGDYLSLKKSDGFLELAPELETYTVGSTFTFYPWGKTCL